MNRLILPHSLPLLFVFLTCNAVTSSTFLLTLCVRATTVTVATSTIVQGMAIGGLPLVFQPRMVVACTRTRAMSIPSIIAIVVTVSPYAVLYV